MIKRSSLFARAGRENFKLLACDVCKAISYIVKDDLLGVPLAIGKKEIADKLVIMSNTKSGKVLDLSGISIKLARERFLSDLDSTSSFITGYRDYQKETNYPVIPVTRFFLENIYHDRNRKCLDTITELNIRQSLPKRPSVPVDADGNEVTEYASGLIAGLIVFPQNSKSPLLAYWLGRRVAVTDGLNASTYQQLSDARPGSIGVEHVKEHVIGMAKNMRRALPSHHA